MVNAPVRCVASRYGDTRGTFSGFSASKVKPLLTIHQPIAPCAAPSPKKETSRAPSRFVIHPFARNAQSGSAKYTPKPRPHILCPYSIQKMNLYSSTVMDALDKRNSGDARYLANSRAQSSAHKGGDSHWNFQSVMDRPERVKRVTPPRTTMLNTHAHPPTSHAPTTRSAKAPPATSGGGAAAAAADAAAFKRRGAAALEVKARFASAASGAAVVETAPDARPRVGAHVALAKDAANGTAARRAAATASAAAAVAFAMPLGASPVPARAKEGAALANEAVAADRIAARASAALACVPAARAACLANAARAERATVITAPRVNDR